MIGIEVKHKMLGIGKITEFDGQYITVEFSSRTSKFIYPNAFETFIKATDEEKQNEIINIINEAKREAEEKHLKEETLRVAKETEIEAAKNKVVSKPITKTSKITKIADRSQRVDGKRMIFFVFQGSTFDEEYKGGYIWAPITNKAGNSFHHWTRLQDVRKGDIILHGCDGYIKAISTACDACYECPQPKELISENFWEIEGRKVDCDYLLVKNPIKTIDFIDDILELGVAKYSPFNREGTGNMGYLFEMNRDLARIFVKETVNRNPYLKNTDYLIELITEE